MMKFRNINLNSHLSTTESNIWNLSNDFVCFSDDRLGGQPQKAYEESNNSNLFKNFILKEMCS